MSSSPRFLKKKVVITFCYISGTTFDTTDMTGNKIIAKT
jgi:hypothetical protein